MSFFRGQDEAREACCCEFVLLQTSPSTFARADASQHAGKGAARCAVRVDLWPQAWMQVPGSEPVSARGAVLVAAAGAVGGRCEWWCFWRIAVGATAFPTLPPSA